VRADAAPVLGSELDGTHAHRLVSLSELQERFGFSERWWRYRIAEGLPARKWIGGLRFDPDEVEAGSIEAATAGDRVDSNAKCPRAVGAAGGVANLHRRLTWHTVEEGAGSLLATTKGSDARRNDCVQCR